MFLSTDATVSNSLPCLLVSKLPAQTHLLVEHQQPLQRPAQPALEPALAAKHRRQTDGRGHVAGGSALAQVGQQQARAGALAHREQPPSRLPVADVAHGLAQVRGVAELLQLQGGEGSTVVAAAVKNCREVAVRQRRLTQLHREEERMNT